MTMTFDSVEAMSFRRKSQLRRMFETSQRPFHNKDLFFFGKKSTEIIGLSTVLKRVTSREDVGGHTLIKLIIN
jgi:hypothetical protein